MILIHIECYLIKQEKYIYLKADWQPFPCQCILYAKINGVHPLGSIKTNFMFEVNLGNGSKDIAFTRPISLLTVHRF